MERDRPKAQALRPSPPGCAACGAGREATLLVDVYHDDWTRLAWVELRGSGVGARSSSEAPEAVEALAAKYEQYRTEPPPGPLLRLAPEAVACWRVSEGGD